MERGILLRRDVLAVLLNLPKEIGEMFYSLDTDEYLALGERRPNIIKESDLEYHMFEVDTEPTNDLGEDGDIFILTVTNPEDYKEWVKINGVWKERSLGYRSEELIARFAKFVEKSSNFLTRDGSVKPDGMINDLSPAIKSYVDELSFKVNGKSIMRDGSNGMEAEYKPEDDRDVIDLKSLLSQRVSIKPRETQPPIGSGILWNDNGVLRIA